MASAVIGQLRALLIADTAQFDKAMSAATVDVKKLATTIEKDLAGSQSRVNNLVRQFGGSDVIGRAKDYAKAVEQAGGAASLTAKHQEQVNRTVVQALAHYKALGQQAPPHMVALANATRQVQTQTAGLGSALSTAKGVLGAFGVTLGVSSLVSFGKSVFKAADDVGDLATKMGVSTDAAQRFQFAARQSGAEIEDVSRAIVKMNDNLAEGDKSTVAALESAGLKFQDIRNMKPEDAFRRVADAVGDIKDPMEQTRVAIQLFGKAGAEILTMIREKSLAAADGVDIMSKETIESLKNAKQSWENFNNALIIGTGEGIVKIGMLTDAIGALYRQIMNAPRGFDQFITDLANNALSGKSPIQGLLMALARAQGNETAVTNRDDVMANLTADPFANLAGPASGAKPVTTAEATRKAREAEEATRKFNQEFADYRSVQLTGLTMEQIRQRQLQEFFRATLRQQLGLTGVDAFSQSIIGRLPVPMGGADLGFTPPGNFVHFGSAAQTPLWIAEIQRQMANPQATSMSSPGRFSAMSKTFDQLPQVIMQALTGGGGVGRSVGGLFGGSAANSVSSMLTSKLPQKLGSMLGSVIPGIGTLLGSGLGALLGKVGSIGQNTTKMGREDFARSLGLDSLGSLTSKLQSLGGQGSALANFGANIIGKKDESANRKWMQDVTKFLDRVEQSRQRIGQLKDLLTPFGGVLPAGADSAMQSLLANPNLPPELRSQLQGLTGGKPSWQTAAERAGARGVGVGALGQGFNQERVAAEAFGIFHDLELFLKFNGANQDEVLTGLADELSAVSDESRKTNTSLPKQLQEFIKRVSDMGLLVDDAGNQIEFAALSFADLRDEALQEVVSLLEQIRDLIATPAMSGAAPRWLGGATPTSTGGFYAPSLPSDSGQLHDMFSGGEGGAMMAPGANITINAVDAASFTDFLKNRGGAEAVVRSIPNVVERWGHAQ